MRDESSEVRNSRQSGVAFGERAAEERGADPIGRKGTGGDPRLERQSQARARPRKASGVFTLDETSLRIDASVRLLKSSEDLGWTNLFAGIASESPHEALHGAIPAVWFATAPTPVDLRRSGASTEQSAVLPSNLVSIVAPGEAVHDEIRSPLEAMHVFLRQGVLDEVAGELYPDRQARRGVVSVFASNDPVLGMFMAAIKASLDEPPLSNTLKLDYLSHALAAHLLRHHSSADATGFQPRPAEILSTRQITAVVEYIDAHLAENLNVVELAAIAGIGRSQFLRRFKASTQQSPYQYVLKRRIQKATQYLADRDLDLVSIAMLSGFANQAHFSVTFKKIMNVTPAEYRRAIR